MNISVEEFNEWYPIGTPVILTKDNGEEIPTNTRSMAWDLCGTPAVMVSGISGGYDLGRIKVLESHQSTLPARQQGID